MKNPVRTRKNWSWLIALAIFMAALGPILHRGPGGASVAGLTFTALCTTDGLKWLNVKTGQIEDGDSGSGQHSAGKSCDCCTGTGPALVSAPASPDLSCGHPMNPTRRNYAPAGYCRVLERPRNPPDDHAQAGVTFHQSDTRAIVDYRPLASHPRSRVKSQGIQLTPPDAQGRRVSARRTSSAGSGEIRASRVKWPSRRPHLVK